MANINELFNESRSVTTDTTKKSIEERLGIQKKSIEERLGIQKSVVPTINKPDALKQLPKPTMTDFSRVERKVEPIKPSLSKSTGYAAVEPTGYAPYNVKAKEAVPIKNLGGKIGATAGQVFTGGVGGLLNLGEQIVNTQDKFQSMTASRNYFDPKTGEYKQADINDVGMNQNMADVQKTLAEDPHSLQSIFEKGQQGIEKVQAKAFEPTLKTVKPGTESMIVNAVGQIGQVPLLLAGQLPALVGSAYGMSEREAEKRQIEQGIDPNTREAQTERNLYAIASASIEGLTEKLPMEGVLQAMSGKKMVKGVLTNIAKKTTTKDVIANMLEEYIGEGLSAIAEPYLAKGLIDKEMDVPTLVEQWRAFNENGLTGAMSSIIFMGLGMGFNSAKKARSNPTPQNIAEVKADIEKATGVTIPLKADPNAPTIQTQEPLMDSPFDKPLKPLPEPTSQAVPQEGLKQLPQPTQQEQQLKPLPEVEAVEEGNISGAEQNFKLGESKYTGKAQPINNFKSATDRDYVNTLYQNGVKKGLSIYLKEKNSNLDELSRSVPQGVELNKFVRYLIEADSDSSITNDMINAKAKELGLRYEATTAPTQPLQPQTDTITQPTAQKGLKPLSSPITDRLTIEQKAQDFLNEIDAQNRADGKVSGQLYSGINQEIPEMGGYEALEKAANRIINGGTNTVITKRLREYLENRSDIVTPIESDWEDLAKALGENNPPNASDIIKRVESGEITINEGIKEAKVESPKLAPKLKPVEAKPTVMEESMPDELKGVSTTVEVEDLVDMDVAEIEATIEDMGEYEFDDKTYEFEDMPDIDEELDPIYEDVTKFKDLGSYSRWTTDVYRNMERVFKDKFDLVKKNILNPLDKAKGKMMDDIISLSEELQENVVDLGIKRKSKESKLVMAYGEQRMTYDEVVDKVGKEMADNIVKADKWFRRTYNETLDYANEVRAEIKLPPIPKRENYYRHYLEMSRGVEALKNIFESPSMIDPKLVGISEYTKPNEKWQSIKQHFTGKGNFSDDAVGGFLDYIHAITYSTHIDPEIKKFRQFTGRLVEASGESKNLNNTIEYLTEFTGSLAGKTNFMDRTAQKVIGRKAMSVLNWANSRMKANAVVGNLSSALSQIANVPQAIATIKNPKTLGQGALASLKSITGEGDAELYKQSDFLKERYINDVYQSFKTRLRDQPQKLAGKLLEIGDLAGAEFIWSSMYRDGINKGVENPIKYADDMTREMVGGRGIGEAPLLQQSRLFQTIAPFTLEVNNVWKVISKMVGEKDALGLMILIISNFFLNEVFEKIRGSGVVFDPLGTIIDEAKKEGTFGEKLTAMPGALAGETLSNLPLGMTAAQLVPEYPTRTGVSAPDFLSKLAPSLVAKDGELQIPSRKSLFGETDPTRFGTGLPVAKALTNPLKSFALPYGGAQIDKTIKGAKVAGLLPQKVIGPEGDKVKIKAPLSVSKSGKIRTEIAPTLPKTLQALAFGGYASPEIKKFFEGSGVPFGEIQTQNIMKLKEKGMDTKKLIDTLQAVRDADATKKDEKIKVFEENGFKGENLNIIMETMYGYKMK